MVWVYSDLVDSTIKVCVAMDLGSLGVVCCLLFGFLFGLTPVFSVQKFSFEYIEGVVFISIF